MEIPETLETFGTDGPSGYWWEVLMDPETKNAASLVIRGEQPPYTEPLYLMHFATYVALDMARMIWGHRLRSEWGEEPLLELEVDFLEDDAGPVVNVGMALLKDAA
jgi:hypothetical protein